jgi:hypothetical protein
MHATRVCTCRPGRQVVKQASVLQAAQELTTGQRVQVIFYELLTQQRYFHDAKDEKHVAAMLLGEQPLPHEEESAQTRNCTLGVLSKCASLLLPFSPLGVSIL